MSDVTMADCYVIGGNLQPPRPMTLADLDSLIRERGVTDEMVERACVRKWGNQWRTLGAFVQGGERRVMRAALEAALMTKEDE